MPQNPIQENCKGEKEWIGSGQTFKPTDEEFLSLGVWRKEKEENRCLVLFPS